MQSPFSNLHLRCQHRHLTTQTKTSALVGSLFSHLKEFVSKDGAISEIIENFSEASSVVLERLNPLLEQTSIWFRLENDVKLRILLQQL